MALCDHYSLEMTGDSMLPAYRPGDTIVVSPNAKVSNGDRVVLRTNGGQVMAKVLKNQRAQGIELASFHPADTGMKFEAREPLNNSGISA
jgi:phage repressor protein C with HTH and peptisase S24 domain